jgi:hypothetical protein
MNLQENIRRILREEVTRKYNRSNENLTKQIVIYLEKTFKNAKTKIDNGGYYVSCDVCVNDDKLITSRFFFGASWDDDNDETPDDQFKSGHLLISSDFVNRLSTLLRVKKSYIMNIIDDWFEDKYIQLIENEANVNSIYLTEIPSLVEPSKCVFVDVPEDITDEEMIDYIDKHTGYRKDEIIQQVESGEMDLRKLYLDVFEREEDKRINGRY